MTADRILRLIELAHHEPLPTDDPAWVTGYNVALENLAKAVRLEDALSPWLVFSVPEASGSIPPEPLASRADA